MCGHDLRIQHKRRQRVSWIDALLVMAVVVVLAVWWRIASEPRPEQAAAQDVAAILPTSIPVLDDALPIAATVIVQTPTPTPLPTASASGVIRHRVRQGETLLAIATQYSVTVEDIQAANGLTGALIRAGDELVIPVTIPADSAAVDSTDGSTGSTVQSRFEYAVQPGDTIISIANRFGSTVEEILVINNLTNNDFIRPGDILLIPVRDVPAEVLTSTGDPVSGPVSGDGAPPAPAGPVYGEPRPIGPANEEIIPVSDAVLLRWVSVDLLAPNEWYVLLIYPISGSARSFPSIWTKATSYRLEPAMAPAAGDNATYAWQVSVVRVKPGVNNQYALEAASPPSPLRSFTWR
jgi:LysM repeat protein